MELSTDSLAMPVSCGDTGKTMKLRSLISNLTPWDVFLRSSLICFLLAIVLSGIALRKIERLPLDGTPIQFQSKRAHQTMTTLSKRFPYRLPWHQNRKNAGDWIKTQLAQFGLSPKEMIFSEVIAGVQYSDLRNIYAEIPGTKKPEEIIVMMAHYDTTDTTVEGAADDASGVGVVLELARVFAQEKRPDRTLLFLLTDSEEFGAFWGARTFARSFDRVDQIIAAANFDFVAPEEQVAILTLSDGLKSGFTPLWLREMALDAQRAIGGFEVRDFMNIVEYVERAMLIPAADHGAFLQHGIPAFNWVGQNKNFAHQMAHYHHTPHDRADVMRVESFAQFGKSAEKLVRSLDKIRLPENYKESSYLKVSWNLYLDGWVVTLIQVLVFVPFFLYSFSKFGSIFRRVDRRQLRRITQNEIKNMAILMGSFMVGYFVMRLLPALKVVTQYETFPATQKSKILYNPNFFAILLVIAFVGITFFIFRKIFKQKEDDADYRDIRHAVHAVFLALIIFLAFIGNAHLATLLLAPPAYFWTAIRGKNLNRASRRLNIALLFAGSITFVIITIVMSTVFHVGVIYWYLFLAATYGLISVYTAVLFFMVMTVMIRIGKSLVFRG